MPLPEGERVLWQGAPSWRGVARRTLHTRKIAGYFAALIGVAFASAYGEPDFLHR